ncbi:MAG: M20/M25/M40 family metallo-hydrolase [Caldisericaceae bacterium]|nr:M20/M25/M40 family metallo-hydrolase [Caldisericaceae bacterium]
MKHIILLLSFVFLVLTAGFSQTISKNELLNQVSRDSLQAHINILAKAGGYFSRVNYTPGNKFAVNYLASYFHSLPGIDSVAIDTFFIYSAKAPYNKEPVMNIVAFKFGLQQPEEIVICGGHYDASGSHESNWESDWQTIKAQGADDNATGTAAVMEMARIISDPNNNINTERTIKFIAFGAEEYHPVNPSVHHAGSLWDADQSKKKQLNLYGALILDMIGYNPNTNYCEVISNNASLWMTETIYQNRSQFVSDLQMNSTPVNVPYSDHQSYQDFGYSAILLMENDRPWNDDYPNYTANPYYHSTQDKPETVNFEQVKLVTQLGLASLLDYAGLDSTTAIPEHIVKTTPDNFNLKAFPNPFNARLKISFTSQNQALTIQIFNAAGELIETLAQNQHFSAGTHFLSWQANRFASGVYFVKVQNENFTVSKKVVLLK